MQRIRVEKPKLLAILKKNRKAHNSIFLEAQKGFRDAVIQELENRLAAARNGKRIEQYIRLPEPEDHTRDYESCNFHVGNGSDGYCRIVGGVR